MSSTEDGAQGAMQHEQDSASRPEGRADRRALADCLLEHSVEPILTITDEGRILTASRAALRLFGYRRGELVGRHASLLMPAEHRSNFGSYVARFPRTLGAAGSGRILEVEGLHRDGSRIPVDMSVVEHHDGKRRTFVAFLRDARERRMLHEQMRRERDFAEGVIDTAPTIVRLLDLDGRIMRANHMFAETTGVEPEDYVGKSWADSFCAPEEREEFLAWLRAFTAGDRPPRQLRIGSLSTPDGRKRRIQWHNTLVRDRDVIVGVLSIGLDVTEMQRTEEMLLRAQKMEAVGRLTGGIAHDFNNLLMGVLGCCRMALERLDEQHSARPLVEEIERSAERSVQLTRRLLTFSRREPAARCVVDIVEIVRTVSGIARQALGEDIELSTRFTCAHAMVEGDPTQIEQIIMNLVVNARDAMPRGGSLTIRVTEDAAPSPLADAGHVLLEVEDTGCGMTPEVKERIFEPFFTTKPPGQGTGLGLPTVFGIVSRMHGQIAVDTAPGLGTRFRITMPRCRERRAADASVRSAAPAIPQVGHGETVLLVEDEAIVRLTLQGTLSALGYKVLVACDAAQALDAVARGASFDVVLTDVVLPGTGGPEMAEALRSTMPEVRVLFMSAHSHEHLVQSGRLRPTDPSLEKPFSQDALAAKLREVLGASIEA